MSQRSVKEPFVQILIVFIMALALVISPEVTPAAFDQQTPPSVENAKKEGEVVWYGTLTGGSIVGRILKSFEDKYPSIKVKYLGSAAPALLNEYAARRGVGNIFGM